MPLARLARPVAAGLVLGAFAGFLSALLRPRSAPSADRINPADLVGSGLRSRLPAVEALLAVEGLLAVEALLLDAGAGQSALAHSSGQS